MLELGCGSGRVLARLVDAGLRCTGLDRSEAMLERARLRLGLTAHLVLGPMERPPLPAGATFRTILLVLDGLGLLAEEAAQVAALRAARELVSHDGRLVVDVSNGHQRGGNEPLEEVLHHLSRQNADDGSWITKWVVRRSNLTDRWDDLLLLYDEQDATGLVRRTTVPLRVRWYTRYELQLLLEKTGWAVEELYGDYDLAPFTGESPRLIVVAAPATASDR